MTDPIQSHDLVIPALGESIQSGEIARWLKNHGDRVEKDEPLVVIESDKAAFEIAAPAPGILEIMVLEGEVKPGILVGRVIPGLAGHKTDPSRASPAARAILRETPPEKRPRQGSGRDGRILKQDIGESPAPISSEPAEPGPSLDTSEKNLPIAQPSLRDESSKSPSPLVRTEHREKMSRVRRLIAQRMLEVQQHTARLTSFTEADLGEVVNLRQKHRQAFLERHGVKLGLMSFFARACALALSRFPVINAFLDGEDIITHDFCDLGVAVATAKGLMVPVIRNAESLDFATIERRIQDFAARARAGKILPADLEGGTFTITNGGSLGSLFSTPMLKPPQSAILGMHTITDRPVARNAQVVIRPMMFLALSYDHRLIDGAEAIGFLGAVKEYIEEPARMLLDI